MVGLGAGLIRERVAVRREEGGATTTSVSEGQGHERGGWVIGLSERGPRCFDEKRAGEAVAAWG